MFTLLRKKNRHRRFRLASATQTRLQCLTTQHTTTRDRDRNFGATDDAENPETKTWNRPRARLASERLATLRNTPSDALFLLLAPCLGTPAPGSSLLIRGPAFPFLVILKRGQINVPINVQINVQINAFENVTDNVNDSTIVHINRDINLGVKLMSELMSKLMSRLMFELMTKSRETILQRIIKVRKRFHFQIEKRKQMTGRGIRTQGPPDGLPRH